MEISHLTDRIKLLLADFEKLSDMEKLDLASAILRRVPLTFLSAPDGGGPGTRPLRRSF